MGFKKKVKTDSKIKLKFQAYANSAIHRYCEKVILPNSYYVYRRLMNNGQVVGYKEYLQMVLDELKVPQESRS